jgi:signal peptidase
MKVFFNGIYYLLVAGIIAVAVLLVATMVPFGGGLKMKVVKSGSMEPAIHTGGIVLIKPTKEYVVGDVVTFGQDTKTQIPTTHRIVAVSDGLSPVFTTKGDANDSNDPANTRFADIHGKVIWSVAYLGYLLDFAKKPLGFALIVGLPALLIIIEEIGKIVTEIKSIRKKKREATAQPQVEKRAESHEIPRIITPTRLRNPDR